MKEKDNFNSTFIFKPSHAVAHKTKKDILAEKIIEMITTGLIQDQDVLPSERELAKLFEVSRETVRGALNKIEAYGLIKISQGSKTKINASETTIRNFQQCNTNHSIDINQYPLEDIFKTRLAIEITAIKEAAILITQKEIDQLYTLVDAQKYMHNEPLRFQMSDQYFHKLLAKACRNELILKYSTDLYNYALITRREFLATKGAIKKSVEEHQTIVDSIATRNPNIAANALEKHLRTVHETTQIYLKKKAISLQK